jgi:hypothetical protein
MLKLASFAAVVFLSACKSAAAPTPATPEPVGETSGCEAQGKQWFVPGGDETRIQKGCLTRCDAAACSNGFVCREVTTNPCGETEDGQTLACMQASAQARVCLPE